MLTLSQGLEIFPACFSRSECDLLAESLEDLAWVGSRSLLERSWCQELAREVKHRLLSQLPELQNLVAVQCTYFNKSAQSNWFVAFHQDRSIPVSDSVSENWSGWSQKEGMTFIHGPDDLLAEMLALRLHLDASTSNNGPIRILSDTHKKGTLTPRQIEALRDTASDLEVTVSQGGIIAMRPLLLHASSKSRTMKPRRVLHFLFGPALLANGIGWRQAIG